MKLIHIESKSDLPIKLPKELIEILPKKIALFTTVQFIENVDSMIKDIEDTKRKVVKIEPKHCVHKCQILGCSVEDFKIELDGFLYVGDGLFHPKALMLKNNKPVLVYNPFSGKFYEVDKAEVENIKKKQKGALLKFLSSKEIGVLISTKPGQFKLKEAEKLKQKHKDKNFYFLISNTIDFNSLEDFSFIECFVNTACTRIAYDDNIKISKPVIDIDELI